jgi:hypothetical protein
MAASFVAAKSKTNIYTVHSAEQQMTAQEHK